MNRYKKFGIGLVVVLLPLLTILSPIISGLGLNHAHAQAASSYCQKYTDPGDRTACQTGFDGKGKGTSKADSCQILTVARQHTACNDGWDNSTIQDDNACESKNNTGLEWLICGVLRAIDDTVNKFNNLITDQLNYAVDQNLSPQVHQAWSIFRILASVVLVIIMLVMILAQASGGGPFDAYTIRKLLPKLVIAIILIQLSWLMFRYLVVVVNDAGKGIGDILAAPFGGQDKISFDNLMGALGSTGVAIGGAGTFLSAVAVIINPFGALMLAFFVVVGVLVALGVLLFRQALITACIIFSPIALVLWILPGTSRYWKLWWENFSKALLLFPIIASMLVIGHIFAWIVTSSGGSPGPLDVFAVIIGFFGPFYLLPKAFSWGGTAMSMAARGIEGGVAPLRNKGKEEIGGMRERHQGKLASKYDPDKNRQGRFKGAFYRASSGNLVPFERGRRLAIAKGDKWKGERDDEAQALMKRQYEMGLSKGYTRTKEDGTKEKMEAGLGAAKQGLVDMVGYDGNNDLKKRASKMAIEELLRMQSFWEMQNATISNGKYAGMRIQDTDVWQSRLQTNPDAWKAVGGKRPDAIPTVTSEAYGQDDMQIMRTLAHYAPEEYKESGQREDETEAQHKSRTLAEWQGEKGTSYRERNKDYLGRRLKDVRERQQQLGPNARLSDAERLTKALRQGYADAPSSPGYAEGWWDEIINQKEAGNTAAQEEMLKQFVQVAAGGQAGLGVLNPLAAGPLRVKVNKAIGGDQNNDILGKLITAARSTDEGHSAEILAEIEQQQLKVKTTSAPAATSTPTTPTGPSFSASPERASRTAAPAPSAPTTYQGGGGSTFAAPSSPAGATPTIAPVGSSPERPAGAPIRPGGEGGVLQIDHHAIADAVASGVREAIRTSPPGTTFHPQDRAEPPRPEQPPRSPEEPSDDDSDDR
jgi:hypothetical protein